MNSEVIKGFLDGLRPEARLTVSEWADTYRRLASVASAEHGQWRTSRTPYLREIMDRLSVTDPAQTVVFMKGAQIGATESGFNWVGYVIDAAPGPMLLVQPTDAMAKRNSKTRLDPAIKDTPRLSEKVKPARSRDSDNTTLQKGFPGGVLIMCGANSPVGLRSMPARYLFLDEVDAYPKDLDGEGDPIDLAKARTRTFAAKAKIYIVSTPTIDGSSAIQREFLKTDQRYYFVPCPHCGHMQHLRWVNLKWEKGKPETAAYMCEDCGALIKERYKTRMLARGEWRSTHPENASRYKYGYHLNSLYSPDGWYSWQKAVEDWEEAHGSPEKLKTFVNTVLGETWVEHGEAPEWEAIYNKREAYPLNTPNNDVYFITAGVDIQKDRIECEIVGWGKGKRSWSLDYRIFMGDTDKAEVWNELAKVVNETWRRQDGIQLPLLAMAVDSGYNTSTVYDFCRRFDASRVFPVKGQETQSVILSTPTLIDMSRKGRKAGHIKLWNIGISIVKKEFYGWLRLQKLEDEPEPPGYCHFPQYQQNHFKGLTAERLEYKTDKRGRRKYSWVVTYERNEPLDCRVYARAAAAFVGIDRFEEEHFDELLGQFVDTEPIVIKKRKSDFWDRN